MKNFFTQNKRITDGFTIVETLIAVTVLMIAIAGPLVVATKGLTSAVYSKNQMIASFLAQESMEVIKSARYNNISDGDADWLEELVSGDQCKTREESCDASSVGESVNESHILTGCGSNGCKIYIDNTTGYNHMGDGDETSFSRLYYIEDLDSSSERTAHVFVKWNEGTIPYEVHLTSQIVNKLR